MSDHREKNGKEEKETVLPKLQTGFKPFNMNYLQHPPRIKPNYGKKKVQILPKTNVTRVLLYDNMTQQQMLDVKLANIRIEKHRTIRMMDLHTRSFAMQRMKKMRRMFKTEIDNLNKKNMTWLEFPEESRSAEGHADVKLPKISSRKSLGNIETVNGITQMFNTFGVSEKSQQPVGIKYKKSVKDPRFVCLEKGLVNLDNPSDGYVELSPSFVKDYSSISRSISRIGLVPMVTVDTPADTAD
ncbi:hypothetical protein LOTGIDRAFT_159495 [Lottia gigantea]|uniref:Uncharacterized protein n=1 Tax=Lottia gigantea TaxID=225164 RepID=V4A0X6_LOTGI|nr:hypothetical protein LOTGIDRAFT_159495 [Lottia gigantea]ESO97463.1 hypothetical protein LOTGIDRAFT_159495 [Lottia gigantea]